MAQKWGFKQTLLPSVPIDRGTYYRSAQEGVPMQNDQPGRLPQVFGSQLPPDTALASSFPDAAIRGHDGSYYTDDSFSFGGISGYNFLRRDAK